MKKDNQRLSDYYKDHTITYGEMDYHGMDQVIGHINTNHNINFDYFMDVGSGRGKLPLQVAALPNVKKSIGIEVVKERHDDAEEIKNKLIKFKNITDKVVFINDDFNEVKLSDHIDGVTLVWISNLCFTQELTNRIFSKLLGILKRDSIIACSKEHLIDSSIITKIGTLQIPMSWEKNSQVYLYRVN